MEHSLTGIPIELLFGAIAGLLAIIYGDLKRESRALRKASDRRDKASIKNDYRMQHLTAAFGMVCEKLKIPFAPFVDRKDDDTDE